MAALGCVGVSGENPIAAVSWCAAEAFCKEGGLRLCGDISSPSAGGVDTLNDPVVNEWYAACSNGGTTALPYGDLPLTPEICNIYSENKPQGGLVAVGTALECVNRFGIADLVGNVAEWTANCSGNACIVRGDSFSNQAQVGCAANPSSMTAKAEQLPNVGFRCCSDFIHDPASN